MRVKSIALWLLAVILAVVLFYFFQDEMAPKKAQQGSQAVLNDGLSAAS